MNVDILQTLRRLNIDPSRVTVISRSPTAIEDKVTQLKRQGKYDEAFQLLKEELAKREKAMGGTHGFTIAGIRSIAELFRDQSRLEEALEWYERVLERIESSPQYSRDGPDTLGALEDIAITLYFLDRYDKALQLFKRVLAGKKKEPRKERRRENFETLVIVSNIGKILAAQNKHEEAIEWLKRALAGFESHQLDKGHHNMISVLYKMGGALKAMGRCDEALQFYKRVVLADDGTPRTGAVTLDILNAMTNAADLLDREYKYDEALAFYRRALTRLESLPQFGKNHPTTLHIVNKIGDILSCLDKFEEGLQCFRRVVAAEIPEEFGFIYLTAISGMASVFRGAGNYPESLVCYQMSLDGHEKMFGKDDTLTLFVMSNMATLCISQGNYDEALKLCKHIIDVEQGKEVITNTALGTMAMAYEGQGKDEEALEWYQRSLAGFEKDGVDNLSSLQIVEYIGLLLCRQEKYDEAMRYFRRVLAGFERIGGEFRLTLMTLGHIGDLHKKRGLYVEALKYYDRALAGQEKLVGKRHKETLGTTRAMTLCYHNLGALCHKEEKFGEALGWYGKALTLRERILPKGHPDTLDTVSIMATIFGQQGRYKAALDFHQRALKGREKELGKDHPSTLNSALCVAETKSHLEG